MLIHREDLNSQSLVEVLPTLNLVDALPIWNNHAFALVL
jgi:hypothetical protein